MKYISYLRYALIVISIIIFALGISSGDVEAMLRLTEGMIIATIVLVIVLSAYAAMQSPKAAGRSLMGFLALAVVVGIAYAMSDTTPIETAITVYDDPATLLIAGTGLNSTFIVAILAVAAIVLTEAYNIVKK